MYINKNDTLKSEAHSKKIKTKIQSSLMETLSVY